MEAALQNEKKTWSSKSFFLGELVILPGEKKLRIRVNIFHLARPWKVLPFECLGCSHIQHDKAQPE